MRTAAAFLFCFTLSAETLQVSFAQRAQLERWLLLEQNTNAARLDRVRSHFLAAGCATREQLVKGVKLPNLICEIPGPEDAVLVVGAHYDKVADSEGVIDNWSGTNLLPALYQALKETPRKHKILFVAFAEEEKGLIGSKYFASQIKKADRAHYRAMVNIDSVGLGETNVWFAHSDQHLLSLLNNVAGSMKLPVGAVSLDQVGRSDSFPFAEIKVPTIDFHSITQETWPVLHTRKDNAKALQPDAYWNTYRLIATYLAYLDQKLNPEPKPLP